MDRESKTMNQNTPYREAENLKSLVRQAQHVLQNNWTGKFTIPSPGLYPHQWSWDSAFIAIGNAHFNQIRAEQELLHLFNAQWSNGMVPHIVFNQDETVQPYFPGPDFWQTEKSEHAPTSPKTSGLCQPPIHATSVLHLLKHSFDYQRAKRFAEKLFPKLSAWHAFLYRERDPYEEGLPYIRHPWGSGQDNSPLWYHVLDRIETNPEEIPSYKRKDIKWIHTDERPSDQDYDRYIYLLDFFRRRNYSEERIRKDGCPFLMQDVLFNSLLCKANRNLAEIARLIGKDSKPFMDWSQLTSNAINSKLWDKKHNTYINFDLALRKKVHSHVLSGFLPLFAGIPDDNRARLMFDYLNTHCFCRLDDNCWAAPSYDRSSPGYSTSKYWRGPIWINMNWLLAEGLQQYGYHNYVGKIHDSIIQLVELNGYREYFDPDTGKGYGTDRFSWTASLLVDVILKLPDDEKYLK